MTIDVSIARTKARGVREDKYAPLEFSNGGAAKAGRALFSDKQATLVGDFALKHLPAHERDGFRLAVLGRLTARHGGRRRAKGDDAAALEHGFSLKR